MLSAKTGDSMIYSDNIYIKTIYFISRTDLIHMFRSIYVYCTICVFNVKVKNLAFNTSKVDTNAWFSMKN